MNFWNIFFGKKEEDKAKKDNQSPFMPEKKEPIEIEFANNFTKKGGRFLFADSKLDCNSFFRKILNENNWNKSDIFFLDKKIAKEFYLDSNELIEKKEKKVTTSETARVDGPPSLYSETATPTTRAGGLQQRQPRPHSSSPSPGSRP